MRYGADHRERTRQNLLREAAAIIRADGVDGLTIGAVSKRLGITHGGFYFHFQSREDLLSQAVVGMFDRPYAGALGKVDAADPKAELGQLVDRYLSLEHCERRGSGCPFPILAGDHGRLPAEAKKRFTQALERFMARVAGLLGKFDDRDVDARAMSAVAEMVGAVALGRVFADRERTAAALHAAQASVRAKLGLPAAA